MLSSNNEDRIVNKLGDFKKFLAFIRMIVEIKFLPFLSAFDLFTENPLILF